MIADAQQLRRLAETQLNVPYPLHDYQWDGVGFLYQSRSALLADEMGLGKTVQTAVALALLLNGNNEINRALIVAPASLTINWMEELATWTPSLTVRRMQGATSDRKALFLLPIPVLIGSYEQIRSDALDRIPKDTFDLVILDEAQRIKNMGSTTALACRLLPRKRAWALSATPLENHENDVKSILAFLDPAIERNFPRSHLVKTLEPLMLRRRKTDVRAELPPVIFQDLKFELSESQKEVYDELWANRATAIKADAASSSNTGIALFGLLTRLKIICNFDADTGASSKLETLSVLLEDLEDSSRVIVFSQFVKTLKWLSRSIDLPHDLLTGGMPLEQRQAAMENFRNGTTPRALMISLRAGGVGLNLGEATHVILFDRWWNPAVERQAVYRAHRFDRDSPLHVIRFLIADTIEERVAEILEDKERLFNDTIEAAETAPLRFTRKELMSILQLSDWEISQTQSATSGGS